MWLSIVMIVGLVGFSYLYLDSIFCDFMDDFFGDDLEKKYIARNRKDTAERIPPMKNPGA